jgi:hypothetical protein
MVESQFGLCVPIAVAEAAPSVSRVGRRWIQTSCLIHNRQPRLDAKHEPMLRVVPRNRSQQDDGRPAKVRQRRE